ncbi:MAG: Spy/CpxP family protein refolding chaperone [Acidiferrobacterales bacterium]
MKRSHKITFATILVSGAIGLSGVTAYGHGTDGEGCHDRAGAYSMQHGDATALLQRRLAMIKIDLRITPAQEDDWQAFSSTVTKVGKHAIAAHAHLMENRPQTLPQQLDRRDEIMKQRLVDMQEIDTAAKKLYEKLTPDQKVIADTELERMHRGFKHHSN